MNETLLLSLPSTRLHKSPIEKSFNLLNLAPKSLPSDINVPEIHIDNDIDLDINNCDYHNIREPPPLSPAMSDTTIIIQQADSPTNENEYSFNGSGKDSYEFINILRDANVLNFLSFYYLTSIDSLAIDITSTSPASYLPNEYETIAHLKLFKAFAVLKKKMLSNSNGNPTIIWRGFITNAVRRFIIFVTALKKFMQRFDNNNNNDNEDNNDLNITKDPAFLSVMSQVIPPLDVLLVWHSFLVNPSSFYDVFVRCNMLQFANFAFPLHKVCQYIDNIDFEFRAPYEYRHNYLEVIKCFLQDNNPDYNKVLQYEIHEFSLDDNEVTAFCPNCKNILSDPIPLSNGSSGFSDPGLRSKNIRLVQDSSCYCSWIFLITHAELRKLQLYSDVKKQGILQGTFKIPPSEVIIKDPIKSGKKFKTIFDRIWKENRFKSLDVIINLLQQECNKHSLPHGRLLQNYTKFNLISMTVKDGIEIGDDLVDFVLKQERFNNKMNNLNWIHSPNINHILSESSSRYAKFFTMLSNPNLNNNNKLKPTLDIELMWKTHNLSAFGYFKDCLTSSSHYIIDDDDTNQGLDSLLNNDINITAEVYKSIYKEDYLICYCQTCTIERAISSINPDYQPQTHHMNNDDFNSPFLKVPEQQQHPQARTITHSNSFDENMFFTKNSEYSWDFNDDDQYSSTSAPAGILTNNSLLDESELVGLGLNDELFDYFSYPTTGNNRTEEFQLYSNSSPIIPGSISPN